MKRWIALLLCLSVLLCLMPMGGVAAENPYFVAVNDALPELTQETAPIRISGVTYIPCTIFDRRVVDGVNLGVSYAWDAKSEKVTLYNQNKILEFNIKTGIAYSYYEDREYKYQAALRNGMPYLPAVQACSAFDITVDFLSTEDMEYQLLRLRDGNEVLDNRMYMRTVRPLLDERTKRTTQGGNTGGNSNPGGSTGNTNPTTPTPTPPTVTPPESTEEETGTNQAVYLSIRVQDGAQLDSILSSLSNIRRVRVVFFVPVSRLSDYDERLRELVGRGHKIGLIPEGTSTDEQMDSLREGNRLLSHILRQKASFVLDEGLTEETKAAMRKEAYLPWSPNISVSATGKTDSTIYQSAVSLIEARTKGKLRILLEDQTKGGTLTSILRYLQDENYDLRALRETDH